MLSTLEKILFLRQVDLFSEFSVRELGMLASKTQEVEYSWEDVIFREGDVGDALYLILGGKVKVVREEGEHKKVIAVLEERTCFGEMAILSNERRTATIEAASPVTLLKIKREDFRNLIIQKPEMAFPIFNILIKRVKNATDLYMGLINPR
jgi:CRP/FNR family transcriptional regulator, cyclic AMP receptor protein